MKKHLNVLVVEDSEDDAVLLLHEIKKGDYDLTFVRVETAEEMRTCLNEQTWDIVISDYSLPKFSAPEALKVLQETGLDLPFIIISGKIGEETAVECMTAGAHDFISKANMVRLLPAIERELNDFSVKKERQETEHALQENENRFRALYSAMNEGVVIHEMIYDAAGEPIDYRILNANPAFESITGIKIKDATGLKASELYGTGEAPYLDLYTKVATSGKPITFEANFEPLGKTFKISVFSPNEGQFATLFADITERKKTEEDNIKLAGFNESIVTSIPVGIVTVDQSGKITSANDHFLKIVGSPSLEDTIKLGLHAKSVEAVGVSKAVENTLMTGNSFEMDGIPYTSHWGKEVIIDLRGVPLKDVDGNATGVVLVIDDVTDIAKAKHALQESEERYEILFDGSPDAIFLADPKSGEIIDANQAASELLQKPINEIIGLSQTQLHPGRMNENSRDEFKKHALKENIDHPVESLIIRSDGMEIPVEIMSKIVMIRGKAVRQGTFRNITERKKVEEQMQLNNLRMNAALELNKMTKAPFSVIADFVLQNISLITKSEYGFVGLMNDDESVFTIHSWSKETMDICAVDNKPIDYPIENAGIWGDAVRDRKVIMVNDYSDPNTHRTGLPEGHVPLSRILSIPIFEDDKIVAVAAVANKKTDYDDSDAHQITLMMSAMWRLVQRQRAEEELTKYSNRLARSNEELKSLDRMKDEFLSNVSHELKTPIVSIKGFSEIMQDETYGPLNEKQIKAVDTIVRSSDRLLRLINSILYLTVQKSGMDMYDIHPVKITDIITNALTDIAPLASNKNLTFENYIPFGLPMIKGDADKLTQVFINLLENATKFTPDGGKITVTAFENGDNINITVADTGIGVSTDVISNLFERFYQVDASTTRKYGGTGIGLYITKLIVEMHNGRIWAESEEGAGTTFHVMLPK